MSQMGTETPLARLVLHDPSVNLLLVSSCSVTLTLPSQTP